MSAKWALIYVKNIVVLKLFHMGVLEGKSVKWFEDVAELVKHRKASSITQAQLATRAGMRRSLLANIETGRVRFNGPKQESLWTALSGLDLERRRTAEKVEGYAKRVRQAQVERPDWDEVVQRIGLKRRAKELANQGSERAAVELAGKLPAWWPKWRRSAPSLSNMWRALSRCWKNFKNTSRDFVSSPTQREATSKRDIYLPSAIIL